MDKINELPQGYDYRPLPFGLYIGYSNIEGNGLFTKLRHSAGEVIGRSHRWINEELIREPLGGFINHSNNPNCIIKKSFCNSNDYILVTLRDIENEEITVNYFNSDCGTEKICKK